jgi:hypothetical protein
MLPTSRCLCSSVAIGNHYLTFFLFINSRSDRCFLFFSFNDDSDDSMWRQLANFEGSPSNRSITTVHLGDQIYVDSEMQRYLKRLQTNQTKAEIYIDTVVAIRNLYRRVWSHDAIARSMRRGENIMLPDDHDLINNLGDRLWQNTTLRPLIRASRQVFLEFQFALHYDFPISSEGLARCAASGGSDDSECLENDSAVMLTRYEQRGSVGLALVDVRFHRSFLDGDQFLEKQQIDRFEQQLALWRKDQTVKTIIVATSLPLFILTKFATACAEIFDGEFTSFHNKHVNDTTRMLEIAIDAAKQKDTVLIAGDMHHFQSSRVCNGRNECVRQLMSSGMSVGSTGL